MVASLGVGLGGRLGVGCLGPFTFAAEGLVELARIHHQIPRPKPNELLICFVFQNERRLTENMFQLFTYLIHHSLQLYDTPVLHSTPVLYL